MNLLRTRAPILTLAFASILVVSDPVAAVGTQTDISVPSRTDDSPPRARVNRTGRSSIPPVSRFQTQSTREVDTRELARCGHDVTLEPLVAATEDINLWGMTSRIPSSVWIGFMLLVCMTFYIPAIFIKRWIAYRLTAHYSKGIESEITLAVQARQWEAALETCRSRAKSPFAKMAEPAVDQMKLAGRITLLSLETVRIAITRSGLKARSEIKRPMRNLLSVSIVAPMIGLLIGIVRATNALVDMAVTEGASDLVLLSGLRECLLALAIGILIGIGAHLTHRFAHGWSLRLEHRLALFESDLLSAYLTSRRPPRSVTARPFPRSVTFLKPSAYRRSANFVGPERREAEAEKCIRMPVE